MSIQNNTFICRVLLYGVFIFITFVKNIPKFVKKFYQLKTGLYCLYFFKQKKSQIFLSTIFCI